MFDPGVDNVICTPIAKPASKTIFNGSIVFLSTRNLKSLTSSLYFERKFLLFQIVWNYHFVVHARGNYITDFGWHLCFADHKMRERIPLNSNRVWYKFRRPNF